VTSERIIPLRRHEERFIASEELARLVMRTAGSHLPLARDDRPFQWSTTTYCDTYDWSVYKAAEAGAALRLRFREYHRMRPDAAFASPRVFLELKDDESNTSAKERIDVVPEAIPAFLRGERILPPDRAGLGARAEELVRAGARPVVVTQYNRLAYAFADDRIRITADHNLIYLAIAWPGNDDDVVPARLGPVLGRETGVVVEVKWFDELPPWAVELHSFLKQEAPDERPSKFIVGMRHLLGVGMK
jgi:hypothetical protein